MTTTLLEQLIARTALGDQQAFSRLYGETSSKLYAIALKLLKRKELAEEVLQEAFIRIWHNAAEYHTEKGAVITWMSSIVRHRSLDLLRRKAENASIHDHDEYMILTDAEPGPLEQALIAGDAKAIMDCIEALQEKQRRSILMAFYEGLTHEQLAKCLDIPLGTIKSWIRRGLERVKQCLG